MLKLDYNIVSKRWNERMATLSKEKVEQIEAPIGKEQLIKLKRSNKPVSEGDIFVLSPKEGVYFYGKILEASIEHINKNSWYNENCHVIFIFNCKSKSKDLINFKENYDKILVGPEIVNLDYWRKGWFETIGNIPLTEEEKKLDYGFFRMEPLNRWGTFIKANGEELTHMPKYFSGYGINTYTGIYMSIKTELLIDPSLAII